MLRRVAHAPKEKNAWSRELSGGRGGGNGAIAVGEVKNAIASLPSSRLKQKAFKGSIRLTENSGQW
jgi:hypothetical protein